VVNLKIGKKTFEMHLVRWDYGAALVPIEDGAAAAPAKKKAHVFSWNRRTGEVTRWHGEEKGK